jgi:hypothetical protein
MPRKDVLSFINQGKNKNCRSEIGTWGKKHPDFLNQSRNMQTVDFFWTWEKSNFGGVSFVCVMEEKFRPMHECDTGSDYSLRPTSKLLLMSPADNFPFPCILSAS